MIDNMIDTDDIWWAIKEDLGLNNLSYKIYLYKRGKLAEKELKKLYFVIKCKAKIKSIKFKNSSFQQLFLDVTVNEAGYVAEILTTNFDFETYIRDKGVSFAESEITIKYK